MSEKRPFRDLMKLTPESKKLIAFLSIFTVAGVAMIFLGVYVQWKSVWITELLKNIGTTFFLAALVGIVYELGMRKTVLAEMETIVQEHSPSRDDFRHVSDDITSLGQEMISLKEKLLLNESLSSLGVIHIFSSRRQLSPFMKSILKDAIQAVHDGKKIWLDFMGYGLTSYFDQIGLYYNSIISLANALERSPGGGMSRMRVIFPHPASTAIIERANAQVKGRLTVESKDRGSFSQEYRDNLIRPQFHSAPSDFHQMLMPLKENSRLYTDIFDLGLGFFKKRTITEDGTQGICVRFTLLNPAFQYIRIGDFLIIEPYHFGITSLSQSGECLSTPEKETLIVCFDLGKEAAYPKILENHFEYIWEHPAGTFGWKEIVPKISGTEKA